MQSTASAPRYKPCTASGEKERKFFMREIEAAKITDAVRRLCIEANVILPEDVKSCILKRKSEESWAPAPRTSLSAKIPASPACSLKLGRRFMFQAGIFPRQ